MTSESGKGSEGRGLPVGFAWSTYYGASSLAKGGADRVAEATATGAWCIYVGADRIEGQVEGATATLRFYGAQAAAEAALWASDGYGTGEVRGRFVPAGSVGGSVDPSGLTAGVIDGLPGLWRVTAQRPVEGGIEVDAVRAPAEPAPLPCPDCGRRSCFAGQRQCDAAKRAESGEPAPLPWNWCPTCSQAIDIDDESHEGEEVRCLGCRAWYVVCRDGEGKWWLEERGADSEPGPGRSLWSVAAEMQGEPAPREPLPVRATAEPVRIAVGASDPLGLGVGEHDAPGGGAPCSCGAWHGAPVAEPAPVDEEDERHPREPGCTCHQEIGDSDCPIHNERVDIHGRCMHPMCKVAEPHVESGAKCELDKPAPREPSAPTALPVHYDDGERRMWIAEALGVPSHLVFLGWSGALGWALNTITIKRDDVPGVLPEGIRADEIATLAAAGIVATAKGWTFAKEQGR